MINQMSLNSLLDKIQEKKAIIAILVLGGKVERKIIILFDRSFEVISFNAV